MKVISEPDFTEWEWSTECSQCGTKFSVEENDLKWDKFKKPGTYWFDGSADAAGLSKKIFVHCPNCRQLAIVPGDDMPEALIYKVLSDEKRR